MTSLELTLNGCECVCVVGVLCVSIVFLDLLSFSLISCVHHRNLVGGVFFYLLLTSVKVCVKQFEYCGLYCGAVITHHVSDAYLVAIDL